MACPRLPRPTPPGYNRWLFNLALHQVARAVFEFTNYFVTLTLAFMWDLRRIFALAFSFDDLFFITTDTFPSSSSSSSSSPSSGPALIYPSFSSLDQLRRPKLANPDSTAFWLSFLGTLSIYTLRSLESRKRMSRKDRLKKAREGSAGKTAPGYEILDTSEAMKVESKLGRAEEDEDDEDEEEEKEEEPYWGSMALVFHVGSWTGETFLSEKLKVVMNALESHFSSRGRLSSASTDLDFTFITPEGSVYPKIHPVSERLSVQRVVKMLKENAWGWFWKAAEVCLQCVVPLVYWSALQAQLAQPPCQLHSTLFSQDQYGVLPANAIVQLESSFPGNTVAGALDQYGQERVILNRTIVYTQAMDRALYVVCAMERVAFWGMGLLGFMLGYQLVVSAFWVGVGVYRWIGKEYRRLSGGI